MAYIGSTTTPGGCAFCEALTGSDDRKNLVLVRRARAFLILNLYPYTPGHLMAVVNRHVGSLAGATADEVADTMDLVTLAMSILGVEYRAEGFNVGLNQGRVAGAGIVDHLHVHVVPRWNGDTNFMPVVADVKVMSEHLEATWARLRAHYG
jgi:ATP adenylyltransferase